MCLIAHSKRLSSVSAARCSRTMILILVMVTILSCGSSCRRPAQSDTSAASDNSVMRHARLLKMTDHDGYTLVTILNPWDTLKVMSRLALVDRNRELSDSIPADYTVIKVPLENSTVASAVHISLINKLGAPDAIKSACDVKYIYDDNIKERVAAGAIIDCGTVQNPDIEKILASGAEAYLLSTYQGAAPLTILERGGTHVIDCAEYMENHPLARAEWMRFFGRLYGKKEYADSLFAATEKQYSELKAAVKKSNVKPKRILTDLPYQGMWNLPGDESSLGITIADAGGVNAIPIPDSRGSKSLAPEKIIVEGSDADIWLIRYNDVYPLDYDKIDAVLSGAKQFSAYKQGEVYGADTGTSHVFEDAAFQPQLLLGDLISIFHPELGIKPEKKYYFQLKK